MSKTKIKELLKNSILIVLGNLMFALTVFCFVEPYGIAVGGFTGVGLALEYSLHIPAEYFVLPANIIVLILGWFVLGKKMVMASIASSILYPVFFSILRLFPMLQHFTDNILLATLIGGAGMGVSIGYLIRVGASTGGTDILCLSLHKWFHLPVSMFVFATDFVIVFGQVFVSGMEKVLLGVVFTLMMSLSMNKVLLIGQNQIQIMVMSTKYEEIRTALIKDINAGVTMIKTQSGLLREDQMGVLCVIHPRQAHRVEQTILDIDPSAFITITQIKEVRGRGFTIDREYLSFAGMDDNRNN